MGETDQFAGKPDENKVRPQIFRLPEAFRPDIVGGQANF